MDLTRSMTPTDAELIVDSTSHVASFAVFYDRHAESLLAYFVRRTSCGQTAADLTAETFAAALASRHRFTDTGAPGSAWLYSIARRQLARFHRKEATATRARRRLGMSTSAISVDQLDRIEQLVDFSSMSELITAALESLPRGERHAVQLRVLDELDYVAVARTLGCSEGAARVRVSRGLSRLANLPELQPSEEDQE